jgi:FAD/FMN-containing dehydrogenase/Fe-S oxidoreductase
MSFETEKHITNDLAHLLKGEVLFDIYNRIVYSTDASIYQIKPLCVVFPLNAEDVVKTVKYADENSIPIAPRGAGSGVAGESLTDGIVIDITKHMNGIIGINEDHSKVTVQPGVVLDDLNDYLEPFGKRIGPDPSSSNRATVGGVVANNATGAHSLLYGYISGHIESIDMVLPDGTRSKFTNNIDPNSPPADEAVADIAKQCFDLLAPAKKLIDEAKPETKRNHSGYNIADICHDNRIDIAKLIAGSEGTLGIITQAVLKTVDLPKEKALVQFEFASFEKMAKAVPIIVDTGVSACELMDKTLIAMAKKSLPQYGDLFPSECVAVLLVEHFSDTQQEIKEKINNTVSSVKRLCNGFTEYFDPKQQARLWKSRKDAVPLLQRKPGFEQAIAFIEDVSISNKRLDEYISSLEKISQKHHITMAYYGHAGDGQLHIRPYIDLSTKEGLEKMRILAEEVFSLAFSLRGSISGEHADGLVRAAFIAKQFGKEYYDLLRRIKKIFDPKNIMNPGKIINDDPDIMTKNLRAGNLVFAEHLITNLNFDPKDFRYRVELCSGDGACLSTQAGSRMCPVFRAVGSELASSRAKANLMRAWITGLLAKKDFESDQFKQILELCINCKMCSVECPSAVDISSLIIEARAELAVRKGLTFTESFLSHSRLVSMAGSITAPLSNIFLKNKWFRIILEKVTGLDHRRPMPNFKRGNFVKKAQKYLRAAGKPENICDKVAYFADSYVTYNDHGLGFAVLKLLRDCNIDVIVPEQIPVPIPAMVYGDLKTARKDLNVIVKQLVQVIRAGYKIICSEPSAVLCLTEELKLFVDNEDARLVSTNTYELMDYLNTFNRIGRLKINSPKSSESIYSGSRFAYHSPCHSYAIKTSEDSVELLGSITDVKIEDLNSGCCGLAGTCGMQKKNYDLSVDIAKDMLDAIKRSDADYIMTECSACKMQIEHLAGKKAVHPVMILAEIYGLV